MEWSCTLDGAAQFMRNGQWRALTGNFANTVIGTFEAQRDP